MEETKGSIDKTVDFVDTECCRHGGNDADLDPLIKPVGKTCVFRRNGKPRLQAAAFKAHMQTMNVQKYMDEHGVTEEDAWFALYGNTAQADATGEPYDSRDIGSIESGFLA